MTGPSTSRTTARRSLASVGWAIGRRAGRVDWACLILAICCAQISFAQEFKKGSGVAGGALGDMGGAAAQTPEFGRAVTAEPAQAKDAEDDAVDASVPPYHVSEVLVSGAATGDRANLTIRITVEINRGSGWHDVPLRLDKAHIYSETASGPGMQLPGVPALQEDGLHWRFRGRGTHHLEFQAAVPVRATPTGRHLQLTLPQMPPLFEARSQITLEGANLAVRSGNREATLETKVDVAKRTTTVNAGVPGGKLDLIWIDRSQKAPSDGAASTVYQLRRKAGQWDIDATQSIVRMEATRNELFIKPPADFKVMDIKGAQVESWAFSEERAGWVRVSLATEMSDRVELQWHLEQPFASGGGQLALSGFEFEGIRTQDGRIRIAAIPGFQLTPIENSLRYVERIEDTPTNSTDGPSLLTYAYTAAGWGLTLTARPVEPIFACRPRLDLIVKEDLATLTAVFELREEAGDVQKLRVDIGALEAAGWSLVSTPRVGASSPPVAHLDNQLEFDFSTSTIGRKVAEARFEKPLSGREFEFLLPAPIPKATWLEQPLITIRCADPLRLEVKGGIPAVDAPADNSPLADSTRLIGIYQPSAGTPALSIRGTVETKAVSAQATVLIEAIEPRRITIEQQISLDIQYSRLESLRLLVPDEFPFTPGAERSAFQIWVDGREASGIEWNAGAIRVPFARPKIGGVRVIVRYALPRKGDDSIAVPVLTTPDFDYRELLLEASPKTGLRLDPNETEWREITTSIDKLRWIADPEATSAQVIVESERRPTDERATIAASFVQSTATDAVQRTVARYKLRRHGATLSFTLPASASPNEISVNGRLTEATPGRDTDTENLWTVRLPPPSPAGPHELLISYDIVPTAHRNSISRLKSSLPQFPPGTFIEEMIWKLTLPESDVLLVSPPGWTRLFDWERRGIFWRRSITGGFAAALDSAGFAVDASTLNADGYAFRQVGPASTLSAWMIDRSLVVLIGAGVTLILGFVFWTVRALQNLVTFLLLGFLLCVAGLWFSEAMQVLLQPALFGIAMASIATAIDGRTRRRRVRSRPHESSIHPVVRSSGVKLNDPLRSTILRPAGSDHGATG